MRADLCCIEGQANEHSKRYMPSVHIINLCIKTSANMRNVLPKQKAEDE